MLKYIEFYAGIGGWSMALKEQDKVVCSCVACWDHSDVCVEVCRHNAIPHCRQTRIEQLSDLPEADIWVLSPPCQPHTRQHRNQQGDVQDARSQSFLHLCRLLQNHPSPPRLILLENVVGFETSESCRMIWRRALQHQSYVVAHFHLHPTQVQVPNDRPRYYCIAIRQDCCSPASLGHWTSKYFDDDPSVFQVEEPVGALPFSIHTSIPELGILPLEAVDPTTLPTIGSFLDPNVHDDPSLIIPSQQLQRPASWCLDIVTRNSRRSSCFTSSYGKFFRGTGSVLLPSDTVDIPLLDPADRQFDPQWSGQLLGEQQTLRYFSGTELLRLFGFPPSFSFPSHCTTKQQWKLVGNSINVRVTSKLVEMGLQAIGAL